MPDSPFKVVWIKATIAFQIPFLSALSTGFGPFALSGNAPNHWAIALVLIAALISGYSGLSSFLSTTFAEHKANVAAGIPEAEATTLQPNTIVDQSKQELPINPQIKP